MNDCSKIVFPKEQVFALALDEVRQLLADQDDLFCLACAGERSCSEESLVEQGLFRVMQRTLGDTMRLIALRGHIEALAQHAGIAVEV